MADSASISVIIPSYNSARWVAEAVESVLAQTLKPAQVIVVDDGSKDDTARVLKPYVDRGAIEYVFQENCGVAAARNTGIRRATGELIAFLDSDDIWHTRKLELQHQVLASSPEIGVLGTATFDWPGSTSPLPTGNRLYQAKEIVWGELVVRNYLLTSSVVVRRDALNSAGPMYFDINLHGPEDYDLWLRIAERWKMANLDVRLTGYRFRATSLGRQPVTMEDGLCRVLRKLEQRNAWAGPRGKFLRRKSRAYLYYTCALMYREHGRWAAAFNRAVRSIMVFPYPFRNQEVRTRFGRPKLLVLLIVSQLPLRWRAAASRSTGVTES